MDTQQTEQIQEILQLIPDLLSEIGQAIIEAAIKILLIFIPISVALLIGFVLLERKRLRTGRWWKTALLTIAHSGLYYLVIFGLLNVITAIKVEPPWPIIFALAILAAFLLSTYGILRRRSRHIIGLSGWRVTILGNIAFGFLATSLVPLIVYLIILFG